MDAHEIPPPLRSELKIRKIVQGGETLYVVKEPDKQEYYRFEPSQYRMLSMFDGRSDLQKLLAKFNAESKDIEYDIEALDELVQSARDFDLLKRTRRQDNAALLERLRQERKKKMLQGKGSLLWMRYELVNPNDFFNKIIDHIRFFWTPAGVKTCIAIMVIAAISVLLQLERFGADFERVYFHSQQGLMGFLGIWLVALGAIALHECGHGLTCKNYGGDVHEMGFLLLAFQPCLYCNVNDAWLFPSKRHKIYVALAGVWVEMLLGALAAFVWFFFDVGNPIGRIAYILMTVSTASSLFVNLNPLLRFDGYYILTDLLEVPNLRQNALALWSWTLKTKLFRLDEEPPFIPSAREKKVYLTYGVLTCLWLGFILGFVAILGYDLVRQAFGFWGIIIFLYLVYRLFKTITGSWPSTLKELGAKMFWSTPERKKYSIVALAVLGLVLFVYSPRVKIVASGEVDAKHHIVYAPEDGFLSQVGYSKERSLRSGGQDQLFTLRSQALELETSNYQASLGAFKLARNAALAEDDRAGLRRAQIEIETLEEQLSVLEERRRSLRVGQPPGEWEVYGPPPKSLLGRFYSKGDKVIDLVSTKERKVIVILEQSDIALIENGQEARVRLLGSAMGVYPAEVRQIKPITKAQGPERLFAVELALTLPEKVQIPHLGMVGEAKILSARLPLWQHLLRKVRKLLRTDLWV